MSSPRSHPAEPELELPKKIGGRYDVVRLVGEGAMGRVLLAHDPVLGRDVAVKLLRDDLRIPSDVREGLVVRMRHEARAAARVAHPNLVTLHDMGEDQHCGLYLVFEYVEGPTLKHRLLEGPLSPRQAARLSRELGAGLTVAHRAGVVHRDIKPENVILSMTGGKIADFGIARIPDSTLTHQGGLLGTPAYSAPETFKAGKFSAESDQFSLAASLYEAISGRRAFPGDDAALVASKIATDVPERFAHYLGLPTAVDEVLARAMSKDPASRYGSCEEFGDAFALALAPAAERDAAPSQPAQAFSPSLADTVPMRTPLQATQPWPPERKTGQVLLGAIVVVVTAALLVHTALQSAEKEESDPLAAPLDTASAAASSSARRPPSPNPPARPPSARPRNTAPETSATVASSAAPASVDAGTATDAAAPSSASDASAPAPAAPKADAGGG